MATHLSDGDYQGLNTNYAIENKFICYIPLENIYGTTFRNLELNVTRWTLPHLNVGSSSVQFKGYTYAVPTGIMDAEDREVTIEYIIDSEWKNYTALYSWAGGMAPFNPITEEATEDTLNGIPASDSLELKDKILDIRIWLINNYKKRVLDFVYHDCWICQFADLAMDVAGTNEIKHSFTCKYSRFTIEKPHV